MDQSVYEPGLLTVDDALFAVAGNQSGNPRIGDSRALPNDTPQLVAPLGFNDGIDIDPGRKSRPQGHGMTCHTPVRPQVLLSQDGIDDGPGLQRRNRRPFRVHQQGNGLAFPGLPDLGQRPTAAASQILDGSRPIVDGFTEGHLTPDSRRLLHFQQQQAEPSLIQRLGHARRQVPSPADNDQFIFHKTTFPHRNIKHPYYKSACRKTSSTL